MNPGDKEYLKVVMQTQEIIVGGQTFSETVEVGSVVRAMPGPVTTGDPEFIALLTEEGQWRWNAPLDDYDPDTVDDEPDNESRWVAV